MSDKVKVVAVIASGETERRALPHLTAHLRDRNILALTPLIPRGNGALDPETAVSLIRIAQYDGPNPPDKYVILIDADGKDPGDTLAPYLGYVRSRLDPEVQSKVLYAYAQWHLEAWYFADAGNLRQYLGRALGHVDTSRPDDILNPKQHLRNILPDRYYTSWTAEDIVRELDALTIAQRSPSFRGFLDAVLNGEPRT